jgi:PAS domain S-box-containing protein
LKNNKIRINKRKRAKEMLRLYGHIVSATLDSVALVDNHYVYLAVNTEYIRRTGKPREAIVGCSISEVMGKDVFEALLKDKLDRCLMGELIQFQSWFDFAAKGRRFIDVSYAPYRDEKDVIAGIVVTARDITDIKEAEESAQVALNKYKTLFEAFPLGITVSDAAGNILETNRMAEQLLGVLSDEHHQRTLHDTKWRIIRPDGSPMPFEEYASIRALREKRLIQDIQMGMVKPSDEVIWLNVTAAPLPLEGYRGVAIDSETAVLDLRNFRTEPKSVQVVVRSSLGERYP